jgi:hypothetical protein
MSDGIVSHFTGSEVRREEEEKKDERRVWEEGRVEG